MKFAADPDVVAETIAKKREGEAQPTRDGGAIRFGLKPAPLANSDVPPVDMAAPKLSEANLEPGSMIVSVSEAADPEQWGEGLTEMTLEGALVKLSALRQDPDSVLTSTDLAGGTKFTAVERPLGWKPAPGCGCGDCRAYRAQHLRMLAPPPTVNPNVADIARRILQQVIDSKPYKPTCNCDACRSYRSQNRGPLIGEFLLREQWEAASGLIAAALAWFNGSTRGPLSPDDMRLCQAIDDYKRAFNRT